MYDKEHPGVTVTLCRFNNFHIGTGLFNFVLDCFSFLFLYQILKCRIFELQWPKQLNAPLEVVDPEIADIIEHEKTRQWKVLALFSFLLVNTSLRKLNAKERYRR